MSLSVAMKTAASGLVVRRGGRADDTSREALAWRTNGRVNRVIAILSALDARNQWRVDGALDTAVFADNATALAEFVGEYEPIPAGLVNDDTRPMAHRQ